MLAAVIKNPLVVKKVEAEKKAVAKKEAVRKENHPLPKLQKPRNP